MTLDHDDIEAIARAVRRPELAKASEIAAMYACSVRTVKRRVEVRPEKGEVDEGTVYWRNVHGQHWSKGDGPKRIALDDWEAAGTTPQRSITNRLNRAS